MEISNHFIITGKNIGFAGTLPEDAEQVMSAENNNYPYVSSNTNEQHLKLINDSSCLHMTIRKTDDLSKVGHIILYGLKDVHRTLEFRRLVVYEKGFGYGREALKLLKRLAFEKLKMHRLWLDVFEDNHRAIKLYESEGFVKEGLFRDTVKNPDGTYRSQYIYSLLSSEFIK